MATAPGSDSQFLSSKLALANEWHQCEVACALDSDSQLALLLSAQAGLADWLDLAVDVDKTLQRLDVFVVKVCWYVLFESLHL